MRTVRLTKCRITLPYRTRGLGSQSGGRDARDQQEGHHQGKKNSSTQRDTLPWGLGDI
jgi:hypothetical protein